MEPLIQQRTEQAPRSRLSEVHICLLHAFLIYGRNSKMACGVQVAVVGHLASDPALLLSNHLALGN